MSSEKSNTPTNADSSPELSEATGWALRTSQTKMKYRKKPVVIDAVQWTGKNGMEVARFIGLDMERIEANVARGFNPPELFIIKTLEGDMIANVGDWIIRGVKGELYPCRSDIFAATYEAVDSPNSVIEPHLMCGFWGDWCRCGACEGARLGQGSGCQVGRLATSC